MKENEPFIIKPEKFPRQKSNFPVVLQLSIVLLILGGLFSGLIIPQTLAILKDQSQVSEAVTINTVSLPETKEELVFEETPESKNVYLRAETAFVWDIKNQKILFQKNPELIRPLASITKLMTALVSYELVPDETIAEISPTSINLESAGTLTAGEKYKIKELADFTLISSFNGAAYVLAETVGEKLGDKDPVAQFVVAMNVRAKEIGLDSLSFKNPTGLDLDVAKKEAGAMGKAKDVAFLVEYILENHPEILKPTTKPTTKLYNQYGKFHEAKNTNSHLLGVPNILGSKTGFTDLAGGNLVIVFDAEENHPVVVVVLNSTYDERFSDVDNLIKIAKDTIVNKN